jgi:hypothetical protein
MGIREEIRKLEIPSASKRKKGEDARIEALRLALETSTPGHAGTPWEHPSRGEKKTEEPELI